MEPPQVLIAGAGPTGLMMACQFAIRNIPFRIVDKNKDHTAQSRAIVIHAASMEIFSQMGIDEDFLKIGKRVTAINYIVKGNVRNIRLFSDFGKGLTQFPFFLALEQSKTEGLLIDFLEKRGHKVEWNTELVSLSQSNDQVQATLNHSDETEERVIAQWLIGADGAKSAVRHLLNIPFGGETYPMNLFVLDCKIDWPLKDDELSLAFSDHSFAGFFPLPGERCRVISFVPKEFVGNPDIRFEDVNAGFAERMQMDIKLYDPNWISTYRAHHRYVSKFRTGRCFLAGDAAHVHSPVGAQGMNTGLHDAYNLAWKLALVIKGHAKEMLLSTYQDERLPFARRLVETTDRAFGVTIRQNPFIKIMRMYVAPRLLSLVVNIKPFARFIFKNISQIGIAYPHSLLSDNTFKSSFPLNTPKPGERLPFIAFEDTSGKPVNIQHSIDGLKMHLFILFGTGSSPEKQKLIDTTEKYKNVISIEPIPFHQGSRNLYKALGIKKEGYYLIRPDLYIAYRSNRLDPKLLEAYLKAFLCQ